jgi:hypothetical protein
MKGFLEMGFLKTFLQIGQPCRRKSAIVRVSYGRRGELCTSEIKISSGDAGVDLRALNYIKTLPHPTLHHPGKNKKRRINQWYDIRYYED